MVMRLDAASKRQNSGLLAAAALNWPRLSSCFSFALLEHISSPIAALAVIWSVSPAERNKKTTTILCPGILAELLRGYCRHKFVLMLRSGAVTFARNEADYETFVTGPPT